MFSGFCPARLEYCSAVWCSAADRHLKPLDRAVSDARFLAGGALEGDIVMKTMSREVKEWEYVLYSTLLSMVYKIRSNLMHRLNGALPGLMCQCELQTVPWSHIGILMCLFAVEPRSTAGLLFHSQCHTGMILLTPYSMVWDLRVSGARRCFFIVLSCSIPTIDFYYFSLSLLSIYRLVLWG